MFSAGECSIEGCTNPARIEIDHVADWADTKITTLPNLASPCGHHHDLKSHRGYTYGPRLPSGSDGSSHPTALTHPVMARSAGPTPEPATNQASSTPADGRESATASDVRDVRVCAAGT